jgi:cellulose synthase/poly-beta-1,6-N-acetylglucosamine synthase-like glycosyltransferase
LLVPAHDEAQLIVRCVASLKAQDHPPGMVSVVVIADNCTDDTAALAERAGAPVLRRADVMHRGKGYAIGWALTQIEWSRHDAVVILDADTTIDSDYYHKLAQLMPLRTKAVQCYDGLSNEGENWLTLLAGMITRNRYDLALPLKQAAGLRIPLTGDGTLLGSEVLARHGWRSDSLTEGWDLYARLTLAGERIELASAARIYAQEARSLEQAGAQRARWTSGRLCVLRENWRGILVSESVSLHQKLDLLAELSSPGPVLQLTIAICGLALAAGLGSGLTRTVLVAAFAVPLVHQTSLTVISLARHPTPLPVLAAALRLPFYAVWRVALAGRLLWSGGPKGWSRTERHDEDTPA